MLDPLLHRRFYVLLSCLMVVAFLGAISAGFAEEPEAEEESVPDDYLGVAQILEMERVSSPQISPDGSQVIYARSHVDDLEDQWESELWIVNVDGSRHRFLTKGSDPLWSPDGTRIAYAAADDAGATQIFVRWMSDGATSQVTRVHETPGSMRWSPDGESIAFLKIVLEHEGWEIELPKPPEGAEWTKPPRLVTKTHYRQDYRGFMKEGFTHVFVVPADSGTSRQLTEGSWNAGARFSGMEFGAGISWTSDGQEILFDGLMDEEPELDGYRQNYIYAVDVASQEVRQLVTAKGDWQAPVVSPDGETVAFVGFPYTLQSYQASELYVAPVSGGEPRKISGDLDRDADQLIWRPDSSGVYFQAGDLGTRNIYLASLGGKVRQVTEGVHMLDLASMSRGELAAARRSSFQEPADVVLLSLSENGGGRQLTRVNEDSLSGKRMGAVEEIWYTSTDNTRVQGWIVKPPEFDESQDYPMILHVHGGPHAMYNVGFSLFYQNLAANGYVVLYTNPRGSTGYGTEFGNAIDKSYPSVDHEDLMAGVDALLDMGYVDKNRLYVTGCSGGGVLSSWAIGHTDRFAAAAVRCPVTNWISFAGTSDIVQWGYHRFDGYFWDKPDKWLEHSPLMHVGKVTTPTLLMTGELDLRTPMAQTEEYYAALKVRGVEAVMLRFNDEYHGTTTKPSNFMRTVLYLVDWFGKHSKAEEEAAE